MVVEEMVAKVNIEVTEIRGLGYCDGCENVDSLKIGDEWTYPEDIGGFCAYALNAILPALNTLRFGGTQPQSSSTGLKDKVTACCSDGLRPVVFTLTRFEE